MNKFTGGGNSSENLARTPADKNGALNPNDSRANGKEVSLPMILSEIQQIKKMCEATNRTIDETSNKSAANAQEFAALKKRVESIDATLLRVLQFVEGIANGVLTVNKCVKTTSENVTIIKTRLLPDDKQPNDKQPNVAVKEIRGSAESANASVSAAGAEPERETAGVAAREEVPRGKTGKKSESANPLENKSEKQSSKRTNAEVFESEEDELIPALPAAPGESESLLVAPPSPSSKTLGKTVDAAPDDLTAAIKSQMNQAVGELAQATEIPDGFTRSWRSNAAVILEIPIKNRYCESKDIQAGLDWIGKLKRTKPEAERAAAAGTRPEKIDFVFVVVGGEVRGNTEERMRQTVEQRGFFWIDKQNISNLAAMVKTLTRETAIKPLVEQSETNAALPFD